MLQGLNNEQLTAVTLPNQNTLILAGAGSGKTRVLTTRIAWLLQGGVARAENILAVTFTNKAAKEMMTRLGALVPFNVQRMWLGTFHGICHRLLRAHHQMAGLSAAFQILDMQDQLSAIKRLCKERGVDEEILPPKELQWFISGCKEEGLRPQDVPAHNSTVKRKVELYQLYEEQCQREDVVDFGELMLRSYELLRDHARIREHYTQRFRYILVDEFQDTSRLQYQWIKIMAGVGQYASCDPSTVLAVGDDDQSIYGFRGANVGNMRDFLVDFQIGQPIKLEENYRSQSHILEAANTLISHNQDRLGKTLRTQQQAGELIRLNLLDSDLLEAKWVAEEVRYLHRTEGLDYRKISVLYRSNAQSRVLETTLNAAGIHFRVYGGMRFFERTEIKHALAYLRLIENPNDNTSFLRVINFPPRGIGSRSIEQLKDVATARQCSLFEAGQSLTGRSGAAVHGFLAKLDVLREMTRDKPLRAIVDATIEHSGLFEHYQNDRDGQDRVENLEELLSAAGSFLDTVNLDFSLTQSPSSQGLTSFGLDIPVIAQNLQSDGAPSPDMAVLSPLQAFLAHAALEAGDQMAAETDDAVQLMTVHASKGLEFDAVFITGLEDDLFPHGNAGATQSGLEEERRLMYVAITRARNRLYVSHARSRMMFGKSKQKFPSCFLREIPENCVRNLSSVDRDSTGYTKPHAWSDVDRGKSEASVDATQISTTTDGFSVRQKVFHAKFGEGVILSIQGKDDQAKAEISFFRHGVKLLALSIAKLTPI